MNRRSRPSRRFDLAGIAVLGVLAAVAGADVRAGPLEAPPPPSVPPKLVNLPPVALQSGRAVEIRFPVVIPRDPAYPGSGGRGGQLGGHSGRWSAQVLPMLRAARCTGVLAGKHPYGLLSGYSPLPRAVPASVNRKWASLLKDTKSYVGFVGQCRWELGFERAKLSKATITGSWTLPYPAFFGGKPGTLTKRFTIRGMCDRPGCPITKDRPFVVLKVSG